MYTRITIAEWVDKRGRVKNKLNFANDTSRTKLFSATQNPSRRIYRASIINQIMNIKWNYYQRIKQFWRLIKQLINYPPPPRGTAHERNTQSRRVSGVLN